MSDNQCCGSGWGSSISKESGSGSGSRVWMTNNFWSKIAIYLSLGLLKGRPSYRKSLQPSKDNIQHFKKCILLTFFLISWVIFALLDSDPIRIHNHNTSEKEGGLVWLAVFAANPNGFYADPTTELWYVKNVLFTRCSIILRTFWKVCMELRIQHINQLRIYALNFVLSSKPR